MSKPIHTWMAKKIAEKVDISAHMNALRSLVVATQSYNIWELGTRSGCSTAALVLGAMDLEGFVTAVEIDPLPLEWESEETAPFFKLIKGDDLKVDLPTEYIDFLFIDTSHEYEHTVAELKRWVPMVRPGGIIALHDTISCPHGVKDAMIDYCMIQNKPYLLDSQQNGLGIIFNV